MSDKFCPCCKSQLDENEFNWKIKGKRRASYCKECSRAYIRAHYQANRAYYIRKAKKSNGILKDACVAYIRSYLDKHPCKDCGEKDIRVLEFDHKDPATKLHEIGLILKKRLSLNKLIAEIDKCEVRCANCHRKRTIMQSHSWKSQLAPVA